MKHSRQVRLVLLGSVSAVSMSMLVACDDGTPTDGQSIFESVEECREFGLTDCDKRFASALGNHVAKGPRYESSEACEARGHERCTQVSAGNGSSVWLPAMIGFMVGNAIGNSRPVYLSGHPNPTTRREREDRQVVAGNGGGSSAVVIGNWYGGGAYSSGSLASGMRDGATRVGAPVPAPGRVATVNATAARSVAAVSAPAARGGFGATGVGAAGA